MVGFRVVKEKRGLSPSPSLADDGDLVHPSIPPKVCETNTTPVATSAAGQVVLLDQVGLSIVLSCATIVFHLPQLPPGFCPS